MSTAPDHSPVQSPRRRFRPAPWSWLAAAAALAVFASLAAWQWQRGTDKERRLARLAEAAEQAPELLAPDRAVPPDTVERVVALGEYLAERQLLQDGQSHAGRPGYHVWTPMRLASGGLVIVNRGWVPQPVDGVDLAPPPAAQSVTGFWRSLPEPGLRLGAGECKPANPFPQVVLYPRADRLACLLGEAVADGLLLLDSHSPGGYVRDWAVPGVPPARHYAYALQWAAFAAVSVVLFVVLNWRRAP